MAQSRFCLKSYGLLQLNNQTLNTNTTGTLFVNNVNVDINRVQVEMEVYHLIVSMMNLKII